MTCVGLVRDRLLIFVCTCCRRDSGSEEAEDGEGEGRLPHHLPERDQHAAQSQASQHCPCQGKVHSAVHSSAGSKASNSQSFLERALQVFVALLRPVQC